MPHNKKATQLRVALTRVLDAAENRSQYTPCERYGNNFSRESNVRGVGDSNS